MKAACILCLLIVILPAAIVYGQQHAGQMETVEAVYQSHRGKINAMLQSLDLTKAGLENVESAFAKGDAVAACKELLRYYRIGEKARYPRLKQPAPSSSKDPAADSIVKQIFTFYDIADVVPTLSSGHLDWSHRGPDDDIEWAWGLNRHSHLKTLLDAYFKTGNPLYARKIDRHIQAI